jgi:hypothetical protein
VSEEAEGLRLNAGGVATEGGVWLYSQPRSLKKIAKEKYVNNYLISFIIKGIAAI